MDAGDLKRDFDVLVFAPDLLPGDFPNGSGRRQPAPDTIPETYRAWLGDITADRTLPQIAAFAQAGGTVVTAGSAHRLAMALGAPIDDVLSTTVDGRSRPLPSTELFIPGALLALDVDHAQALAFGAPERLNVFFDENAAFRVRDGAQVVGRYPSPTVVTSGWAIGPEKLSGAAALIDAPMGQGRVIVLGPDVVNRAQARASVRFLFNALLYGPATAR